MVSWPEELVFIFVVYDSTCGILTTVADIFIKIKILYAQTTFFFFFNQMKNTTFGFEEKGI